MKKKTLWLMPSIVMTLILITVFINTYTTRTLPLNTVKAALAANWWDELGEPIYGGKFTLRTDMIDNPSWDAMVPMGSQYQLFYDRLIGPDWTVNPKDWDFSASWVPMEYWGGLLAESWERPDPLKVIVHLRKGVRFQNREPVNGREFVAADVEAHYARIMGLNGGKPSPFLAGLIPAVKSVKALDSHTVAFNLKVPSVFAMWQVYGTPIGDARMEAPEVAAKYGSNPKDPKNCVGTGPWIMKEFVNGSSITYVRNPDYWGRDERYPDNQIPYIETFRQVAIIDMATTLAAIRTQKIDMIAGTRDNLSLAQVTSLEKTDPEIKVLKTLGGGMGIDLRVDNRPFTDIRVRQALQLAVDTATMGKSRYNIDEPIWGFLGGTPGWSLPFNEWPRELQDEYSYNPEKSRKLLADAGYPNGFETECAAANIDDVEGLQVVKSYFEDIGVKMDINLMDNPQFMTYTMGGKNEQMALSGGGTGGNFNPAESVLMRHSTREPRNFTHNNDSRYDDMVARLDNCTDMEEAKKLYSEMQLYALKQHWSVVASPRIGVTAVWQSYVKGYNGQSIMGPTICGFYAARVWIDENMKD